MTAGREGRAAMARDYRVMALLLAALVAAPFLGVYPVLLMKILCFALFATAFNLLLGYSGLLSFGHAAFFGGAAYITGYLCKDLGAGPVTGILAGTAFAVALGWVFGSLAIRRAGIYFAMITLALAQMMYFVWIQLSFTGGEDGLQGIPRGRLAGILDLSSDLNLYFVVLAICAAGFWIVYRAIHSPFGQVLKAIRENEPRAVSLGYDVDRVKLLAFTLSAGLAGLAGAMKCLVLQLASLTDVHWHMSGEVVLMTLLGGLGTVFGPLVGAALVVV
ncbi:MAG TPA: branched-chain amino acid ABC transporter permease, partial [Burkholderiales bacterium]|nr:branched-chain amino acid ABC transporter permease [Burkholderiales bacterium]